MPEIKMTRGRVRELEELDAPLRAEFGDAYAGAVLQGDDLRLVLADDLTSSEQIAIEERARDIIKNIDLKTPPPSERMAQRKDRARDTVRSIDLGNLSERIKTANNMQALRDEMVALAHVVQQMALALDMNETELPDTGA